MPAKPDHFAKGEQLVYTLNAILRLELVHAIHLLGANKRVVPDKTFLLFLLILLQSLWLLPPYIWQ